MKVIRRIVASVRRRGLSAGVFLVCALLTIPASVGAQSDNDTDGRMGVRLGYHSFFNQTMRDIYNDALIVTADGVTWLKDRGVGFGAEFSWMSVESKPPRVESNWNVSDSWIRLKSFGFGLNVFYRFMNKDGSGFFTPYVGLGPSFWVGGERVSATASRDQAGIQQDFRAELLAVSLAAGGNAILGSTFRLNENARLLVEVRWTQSSGGSADLVEEAEKGDFASTLYDAVGRSTCNFTGWRIDVGAQW